MATSFGGQPPAGVSTHRLGQLPKETKIACNTSGILNNNSREALRCFAAHSLMPTQDLVRIHGQTMSRRLRVTNETQRVTDFAAYQATKRSMSTGSLTPQLVNSGTAAVALPRPVQDPYYVESVFDTHTLSQKSAPKALPDAFGFTAAQVTEAGKAGLPLRHLLHASGRKSEAYDKVKVANFSAVNYNFIADQATPIKPYEKTAFMSHAHRDAPGASPWPFK
eukprot:TRINITY_DN30617_c0_g1_i1.p1 TRINITY_DN30617_c0_g1~~TRINITY_DN30617_c0_g1_i1.p1  ORF type:complete len:222 (-),score=41.78 TRINITY_DN30617_c0_g1_i1:96-761(-)